MLSSRGDGLFTGLPASRWAKALVEQAIGQRSTVWGRPGDLAKEANFGRWRHRGETSLAVNHLSRAALAGNDDNDGILARRRALAERELALPEAALESRLKEL